MSVNVQYLYGLVMDFVMMKPTPLNAIMMVEIAVVLVLILSIVLNAHVIIVMSQSQVNHGFSKREFSRLHKTQKLKTKMSLK